MAGAAFDAAACSSAAFHFASGATARNAFGARICYFWFFCRKQFSPGQDKGTHKLGCACLATYVRGCVRRQNESREKGQGLSPHVICWAVSASFRSDIDRGKSVQINSKLASFTTSQPHHQPSTLYFKKVSSIYFPNTLALKPFRLLQTCGKSWP